MSSLFASNMKAILTPYYFVNILMSISYILFKKTCSHYAESHEKWCEMDYNDTNILFFLLVVITIRSRKNSDGSLLAYLRNTFIYCKVANLVLWYRTDFRIGILYAVLILVFAIWLPQPTYEGPNKVIYFRTCANLDEELNKDKSVAWLVCFYTTWNPVCVNFAPIFAQLSSDYALENFKFGKIDVGQYPEAARNFGINDASTSAQLPTVVLFKNGRESCRRPHVSSGKLMKFFFTEDNVKATFDLNNVYKDCKGKKKIFNATAAKSGEKEKIQ